MPEPRNAAPICDRAECENPITGYDAWGQWCDDHNGGRSAAITRDPACVEAWPECEEGAYDPRCCRFPKSCSCTVYDGSSAAESLFSFANLRERYEYQTARPWEFHESTANMVLALVEIAERADELSRFLGRGGDPDLRNVVARLDVALEPFRG